MLSFLKVLELELYLQGIRKYVLLRFLNIWSCYCKAMNYFVILHKIDTDLNYSTEKYIRLITYVFKYEHCYFYLFHNLV